MAKPQKRTILFMCTHNSSRSQMAEGLVNHFHRSRWEASSAGTSATKVHPHAIKVMKEIGIDISKQASKDANKMFGKHFDIVATLCSEAEDECPFFIEGDEYIHKSFADPTEFKGTEEQALKVFRKTRDDLKAWIDEVLRNQ
jgi:arsenate reductase (thioredoxin)